MESTGIEKNAVQNGLIEGGADEFTPIKVTRGVTNHHLLMIAWIETECHLTFML